MQSHSSKKITIAYWVSTIIFALFLIGDGLGGVLHAEAGVVSLAALGYPVYLLTIIGTAKILAAFAILQNTYKTLKEWAFAGFTINCIGAFASHYFSHSSALMLVLPFIFLGIMAVPYILWKKIGGTQ